MNEYDPQMQNNINLLEEIEYEIRDMAAIGLEEDIELLKRGWDCDNGNRVKDTCIKFQDELFNITKNLQYIKESMIQKRY